MAATRKNPGSVGSSQEPSFGRIFQIEVKLSTEADDAFVDICVVMPVAGVARGELEDPHQRIGSF